MVRQLFLKELRLQQSGIYFAIAVMLVGVILSALASQADWSVNTGNITPAAVIEALYVLFVIPSIVYVVPIFVGAAMIAEERRLGMWDWQIALPLGKIWQVLIKLFLGFVLVFTAVFILMPLMNIFMLAAVPNHRLEGWLDVNSGGMALFSFPFSVFIMMCAAYASSMLSDSYKAFWLGIVLAALFALPILWGLGYGAHHCLLRRFPPIPASIVYVVVMLGLIYNFHDHFRFESMSRQRIGIDIAGTALVIGCLLFGASFFKAVMHM